MRNTNYIESKFEKIVSQMHPSEQEKIRENWDECLQNFIENQKISRSRKLASKNTEILN